MGAIGSRRRRLLKHGADPLSAGIPEVALDEVFLILANETARYA
jgi:hypothetical protein